MAAISALEALKRPCTVDLHTDCQYVRQRHHEWIHGWKRNGWKTADKKPVKNDDLWQRLDAALQARTRCAGTGSRATPATPRTSAPTSSRGTGSRRTGSRSISLTASARSSMHRE